MIPIFAGYIEKYGIPPISARIIVVGASIMDEVFGDNNGVLPPTAKGTHIAEARFLSVHGLNIDVYEHSVRGETIDDLAGRIDSVLAGYSTEDYPTYVFIHDGGNDVSATRPYSGVAGAVITAWNADIEYICDAVVTKGFEPVLSEITFRNYDDTTIVQEDQGSLPYNTNIYYPQQVVYSPDFIRGDSTRAFQLYGLMKQNYDTWIQSDGIHPTSVGEIGLRNHIVDVFAYWFKNAALPPTALSPIPNRSFVNFSNSATAPLGNFNHLNTNALGTNTISIADLTNQEGDATGISMTVLGSVNLQAGATDTGASGTDYGYTLENRTIQNAYMFINGSSCTMSITFGNLNPLKTYTFGFRADRNGLDAQRTQTIQVQGGSVVNYITNTHVTYEVSGIVPDGSNEIVINLAEASTANSIYVSGISIEEEA